jgi:hypothetical protein
MYKMVPLSKTLPKNLNRKLVSVENVKFSISLFLRITLIIAAVVAFFRYEWLTGAITVLILLFTFLPALIERNYKVYLPSSLTLAVNIFIYGSLFLGEIYYFYTKFWWWDVFLHTSSGFILGFAGFLLVYVLNEEAKIKLDMSVGLMAMFAFAFAVTLGVFWEMVEFAIDLIFSYNMQNGLVDTMTDLIVDSIGALVISIAGYIYIKRRKEDYLFNRIIVTFMKKNPQLFKKRRIKEKIKKITKL